MGSGGFSRIIIKLSIMAIFKNKNKRIIKINDARRLRGYSLVEMAVVFIIFGLLFGMIRPVYLHYVDVAKSEDVIEKMKDIEMGIDQFFEENGHFPDTLDEVFSPPPLDPWGNPYQYLRIDGGSTQGQGKKRKDKNLVPINSDYDLYSSGPDGQSVAPLTANASQDDIVRGRNGDFIGYASDY